MLEQYQTAWMLMHSFISVVPQIHFLLTTVGNQQIVQISVFVMQNCPLLFSFKSLLEPQPHALLQLLALPHSTCVTLGSPNLMPHLSKTSNNAS